MPLPLPLSLLLLLLLSQPLKKIEQAGHPLLELVISTHLLAQGTTKRFFVALPHKRPPLISARSIAFAASSCLLLRQSTLLCFNQSTPRRRGQTPHEPIPRPSSPRHHQISDIPCLSLRQYPTPRQPRPGLKPQFHAARQPIDYPASSALDRLFGGRETKKATHQPSQPCTRLRLKTARQISPSPIRNRSTTRHSCHSQIASAVD